ncbi:hypothetical protein AYO44_09550 [Planctomycetaceae bacterium SCGC AG-212-F19]|nr:hypothetical protein AYO44_09550 [Planctomycetaceae bacterium SCGC AG-212-F19]
MAVRPVTVHRRRVRRTLLWGAALFLLVQLGAGVVLDRVGLAIRFPSAARALDRLPPDGPEIVCLGSSRFIHGLPERELQQALDAALGPGRRATVFNAAVPAGDPVSSEYMYRALLSAGARPRCVIVEITPEALNHFNTWLSIHVQRQLTWADVPAYFRDLCFARQLVRLLRARFLPLYVHRRELCRAAGNALSTTGTGALAMNPATPLAELEEALRQTTGVPPSEYTPHGASLVPDWLRHYHVGGTAAAALTRLLQRCQANGSAVLLVCPPLTDAHQQAYSPAIEAAFQGHIRQLTAQFPCRFVDFRNRLPVGLFIDNHHLRPEGGERFSALLAHEVLAPAVRDTWPCDCWSSR